MSSQDFCGKDGRMNECVYGITGKAIRDSIFFTVDVFDDARELRKESDLALLPW